MKSLYLAKKQVDDKNLGEMDSLTSAAASFELRAQRLVSDVYSLRQESLKKTLDAAAQGLEAYTFFGKGKEPWDAGLATNAKQETVFAKAADTYVKTSAEVLTESIDKLSQACLIRTSLKAFARVSGLQKAFMDALRRPLTPLQGPPGMPGVIQ